MRLTLVACGASATLRRYRDLKTARGRLNWRTEVGVGGGEEEQEGGKMRKRCGKTGLSSYQKLAQQANTTAAAFF
ncbi:hypothetical protein EYF80_008023 [Liparis tanakae]|uniref:Uncharacterized protein n=1 Tax=Liparis tanakae TaxID=230148 RepID=A0A4Z2IVP0_9TELE|nr:hypothetical protein EYF80_008023 [Liparis tanakae]